MEQEKTFKKSEIIFSNSLGVCRVAEVSTLNTKKGSYLYYKLESVFTSDKFCYLPVVGHQMKLREIITVEKAQELQKSSEFANLDDLKKQEIEYVLSEKQR